VIGSGRPLVVFPGGRKSNFNSIMKPYPVPAVMAIKSGAVLVPVALPTTAADMPRLRIPGIPGATLRILPPAQVSIEGAYCGRLRREQATRSEAGGGWYDTCAVVEVNEDGMDQILGRIKRVCKDCGRNGFPRRCRTSRAGGIA
jgi:hypothetical protein